MLHPLLLVLPAALAQEIDCASGVSSAASSTSTWVEPHPIDVVRQVVTNAIPGLGYSFQSFTTTSHRFVTAPKLTWSDSPTFTEWWALTYPGAQLTISLDSVGLWTRVSLRTRLLCATGQRPPPRHPQGVDFDHFVLHGTHSDAENAIRGPLRRTPVRRLARSCEPLGEGDPKIAICARIAAAHPDDADAQRQHAFALARFYRASNAWKPLQRLFALAGEQRGTYDSIGTVMLETHQYADARKLYERGVVLWPTDVAFRFRLARANLELRRFKEALSDFLAVLDADTTLAESHYYAAVALAGLKRRDDSRTRCRTALEALHQSLPQRAKDAPVWLGLAYCAAILEQDREAVAYFTRAEEVDSEQARLATYVRDVVAKSFRRLPKP